MFEGTDLNSAYNMDSLNSQLQQDFQQIREEEPSYQYNPVVEVPVQKQPEMVAPPKKMVSVQQPGDLPYNPPQAMYNHEKPSYPVVQSESFWDRVSKKRFEVLKVFMLSLIVVLALSIDKVASHYLSDYLSNNMLTNMQELFVRISYPVFIILVVWLIKSM
jgi:hypothetical protein